MFTWLIAGLPLWIQVILVLLMGLTLWFACQWISVIQEQKRQAGSLMWRLNRGLVLARKPELTRKEEEVWWKLDLPCLDQGRPERPQERAEKIVAEIADCMPGRMEGLAYCFALLANVAPVIGLGGTVFGFFQVLSTWDPVAGMAAIGPSAAIAMKSTMCSVLVVVVSQLVPGIWRPLTDTQDLVDQTRHFLEVCQRRDAGKEEACHGTA